MTEDCYLTHNYFSRICNTPYCLFRRFYYKLSEHFLYIIWIFVRNFYIVYVNQNIKVMSWHLISMVVLSILYLIWKIYVYSTSIKFNYHTKKHVEHTKWEMLWINSRRRFNEFRFIINKYFEWYGFNHIWPIVIGWLIYGGIFIW